MPLFNPTTGGSTTPVLTSATPGGDSSYLSLRGINFGSGNLGYMSLPAVNGSNYLFPDAADVAYMVSKGCNFTRIVFCWEALQPTLGGSIVNSYTTQLQIAVNLCLAAGMWVMIEPHPINSSFGASYTYNNVNIGTSPVTIPQFANLWTNLANTFTDPGVIYGLCNEPNNISSSTWQSASQAAITAIRATGRTNMIFVQPVNYGSVVGFFTLNYLDNSTAPSVGLLSLTDPLDNLVVSLHHYYDSSDGYSGAATDIAPLGFNELVLGPVISWCQSNNWKLHISEFAVDSTNAIAAATANDLYNLLATNADVCIGASWWVYTAVGFGPSLFDLQPTTPYTVDDPDMALFTPFTDGYQSQYSYNWQVNEITGSIDGYVPVNFPMALGYNTALTGQVRLPNLSAIKSRNAANTADVSLIYLDGSNNTQVGASGSPLFLPALNTVGIPHITATTGAIASSLIVNADVSATAALAVTKLAAGTTTQMLLMNATTPTWTTLSGDMTIGATGATTVAKVNGTAVPAAPAANSVLVASSTTAATWSAVVPVTLANIHAAVTTTTAQLQVIGATVAANTIVAGTTYRFRLFGFSTNIATTTTFNCSVRIGPTTLTGPVVASGVFTSNSTAHATCPIEIEAVVTCYSSTTAIGQVSVIGLGVSSTISTTGTIQTAVTIVPTGANIVQFTFFTNTVADFAMTITNATLETYTL